MVQDKILAGLRSLVSLAWKEVENATNVREKNWALAKWTGLVSAYNFSARIAVKN